MDIHTKPGTKVMPLYKNGSPLNGYESDQAKVAKYLPEGSTFTVDSMNVRDWGTDVYPKEVPDVAFNSVCFVKEIPMAAIYPPDHAPIPCSDFLDLPAIYGYDGELPFGQGCRFAVSADPDPEYPQVNLHAHKEGIGGMFDMTPEAARELGKRLIAAADAVDKDIEDNR